MASKRLLIVDDEENIGRSLRMILEREGYAVSVCRSVAEFNRHPDAQRADAYLLDMKLPDGNGIDLLRAVRQNGASGPAVMISGHGTIADAVEATRAGAFDFLEKPLGRDRVLLAVKNALEQGSLRQENERLREMVGGAPRMIGSSPAWARAVEQATMAARSDARVLLIGDSVSVGYTLAVRQLLEAALQDLATLIAEAEKDDRIVALTAAMPDGIQSALINPSLLNVNSQLTNSTHLILPNGLNITTKVGDVADFIELDTTGYAANGYTKWQCINYSPPLIVLGLDSVHYGKDSVIITNAYIKSAYTQIFIQGVDLTRQDGLAALAPHFIVTKVSDGSFVIYEAHTTKRRRFYWYAVNKN